MKKNSIYLSIITSIFFTSCSKLLEIEPINSVTIKNGVKTEKDIRALLSNLEMELRSTSGLTIVNSGNALPRKFDFYTNWVNPAIAFDYNINQITTAPNAEWNRFYTYIQLANIPLGLIDQTNMPEERKVYYKGQANFYKAFAYLWLIRIFGDVILIKDDVILDHVEKTAWPIVADYAIELAENAVMDLPEYSQIKYDETGNRPINKFTPSKGAANALLAELCAWKAGMKYTVKGDLANYDANALWQKAEKACTEIISSNEYLLASNPEEVCESVLVGNSKESIFEVDVRMFWDEIKLGNFNFSGILNPPRSPVLDPMWSQAAFVSTFHHVLADSINRLFEPQDLRRKSYFYKLDSLSEIPVYNGFVVSNKFRKSKLVTSGNDIGSFDGVDQNWIIWRLSQIYLLRAECRARLNESSGAIADLDKIRQRSNASPYNYGEGDLRFAVFEEKTKKEMIFEHYSYWFDIVRNEYAGIELKKNNFDKLSTQDIYDGALFTSISNRASGMELNPRILQNVYWFKRFGW